MTTSHMKDLAVAVGSADHVLAPAHPSISIVEYGDFKSPNCKEAAPALKNIVSRFEGRVGVVFRHFPPEEIHPHALHAALAAETAGVQGKFWEMHDLPFENQAHLGLKQLRSCAERLELDMGRYDSEMRNELYLQRVREDIESGRSSRVRATPGLFIDEARHDVSFGLYSLADRSTLRSGDRTTRAHP